MEFRQLEAFVAVATELHFGRAAETLHMSQPTLSELVRRLEREMGTPLLTRTTRRVALTGAGAELLDRAEAIVSDVSSATAAVRRVANGEVGTVRLGIVPNVEPVLAPHVADALRRHAPDITLDVRRMWPLDLQQAVTDGTVDVAITCGFVVDPPGVVGEVFCGESVLVALRSTHRLAGRDSIAWTDLAGESFGIPSASLFPEWSHGAATGAREGGHLSTDRGAGNDRRRGDGVDAAVRGRVGHDRCRVERAERRGDGVAGRHRPGSSPTSCSGVRRARRRQPRPASCN